ncbi:class I SAM-dependent DNA methyltransferase [Tenacibaculum agarivorans]|uniref:class I SAM-dependent DNA methyltransferase n=1 Tax=Tenacibaculum agarivorans TaxID=1908389 RepID=UPI00094B995C|nr:class I SAM-dependent methyltransferase [Tenacibaculum agarivorans]
MQNLYSKGFEKLYDEMYQVFIDYENEFNFYNSVIKKNKATNVLEIGCGSGHLAKHFIASGIDYYGMDLSSDMINLSRKRNPKGTFIQGNMTDFSLTTKVDATLITGRTTSYLNTNLSVYNMLNAIYNNLNKDGILCFDFIDANRFFAVIKDGKEMIHNANINERNYSRISFMEPDKKNENFMFQWNSKYYETNNSGSKILIEDISTVRAFTKNEWELFLKLSNFKIIEIVDRKSYAFDTYVIVAQKQ